MLQVYQIIVFIFALFALSRAILRAKESKITRGELYFWSLLWLGVLVLTFLPSFSDILADYAGIGRGADLLVYASVLLLFYLMFRLYVKIDKTEQEITKLVQKVAYENVKKKK
ncbi:DUF2304 family protein [Candidatus Woesearchaeota archaeon]|nr:DUF2304 family protein [Candidatus Woesearchaeota archaeon]